MGRRSFPPFPYNKNTMERGKRQMKVIKTVLKMLGAVSITAALITGNHLIAGGAVIFSGIAIGIEFAEWRK